MKEIKIKSLDENEIEIASAFKEIGICKKHIAQVLICLMKNNGVMTSRDLEIEANLRQPQISVACNWLYKELYITKELKRVVIKGDLFKRGRPRNAYALNLSNEKIISLIKFYIDNEYNRKMALLEKIEKNIMG